MNEKKRGFNFNQVKAWVDVANLTHTQWNFATWLRDTKGGDYTDPTWIANNVGDLTTLIAEYNNRNSTGLTLLSQKKSDLQNSIQERLDKYTITGLDAWDAEKELEAIGTNNGAGSHWGGTGSRGATWKDFINSINKDDNSNDDTNYKSVEFILEYVLTETLLTRFIQLNKVKKMKQKDIYDYVHQYIEDNGGNLINEGASNFYHQHTDESDPTSDTYKEVIEYLNYK